MEKAIEVIDEMIAELFGYVIDADNRFDNDELEAIFHKQAVLNEVKERLENLQ